MIELNNSDSTEQINAEKVALEALNQRYNSKLTSQPVSLSKGKIIQVDGYDGNSRVACEIYCRVGALKPAQKDKIASDILKLLLIERLSGHSWKKIICFVDDTAAKPLTNSSWLAYSCEVFGIIVEIVKIPNENRIALLEAQERQKTPQKKLKVPVSSIRKTSVAP